MIVNDILEHKGSDIYSVTPTASLLEMSRMLHAHKVGALIWTDPSGSLIGIITERDLANAIARFGHQALDMLVADFMNRDVVACSITDEIDVLLTIMTEARCRHLPVIREGVLVGLVSIGDLVKARFGE